MIGHVLLDHNALKFADFSSKQTQIQFNFSLFKCNNNTVTIEMSFLQVEIDSTVRKKTKMISLHEQKYQHTQNLNIIMGWKL